MNGNDTRKELSNLGIRGSWARLMGIFEASMLFRSIGLVKANQHVLCSLEGSNMCTMAFKQENRVMIRSRSVVYVRRRTI
jgi:hypothetical protein